MKRVSVVLAAITLVLGIVPGVGRAAETHRVFMTAPFVFCNTPGCTASENTTIKVGDTVEWVFADPACVALHALGCTHTATRNSTPSKFDSGLMPGPSPTLGLPAPKLTYSKTFTAAGNFAYFCAIHVANQGMKATIVVTV